MLIDLGDSHRLVFCANHPGTSVLVAKNQIGRGFVV